MITISSQKSIPFWGDLTMWLYFPVKNLSHSEGQLTMWLYFSAKSLSHSEGNWLCDYTFRPNIYPILRGTDFVIILSCQESIPFWGDLTMWSQFLAKNLSHSEGTWLCDHKFQLKIYPILMWNDYVIILFSQKSIPFWGDLTTWS